MSIEEVVAEVLRKRADEVNDETSPTTVGAWDSLRHIELVMAVEMAFGVAFPPAEVATMTSVGAIRHLLQQKGVQA